MQGITFEEWEDTVRKYGGKIEKVGKTWQSAYHAYFDDDYFDEAEIFSRWTKEQCVVWMTPYLDQYTDYVTIKILDDRAVFSVEDLNAKFALLTLKISNLKKQILRDKILNIGADEM